ncbi:MAG: hypothetical protein K2M78_12840 [Lachnospiraceae bacterium]|nr:hypothetical protein [Lachnospiraceae bacterium]
MKYTNPPAVQSKRKFIDGRCGFRLVLEVQAGTIVAWKQGEKFVYENR